MRLDHGHAATAAGQHHRDIGAHGATTDDNHFGFCWGKQHHFLLEGGLFSKNPHTMESLFQ
jgi:hypothetical protein